MHTITLYLENYSSL